MFPVKKKYLKAIVVQFFLEMGYLLPIIKYRSEMKLVFRCPSRK